ncbi:DNA polymerase/3'-5' exonuclease PolX [Candidatus Nitrospira bockiana]
MPLHNADIAARLDELADLLEIEGENVFRVRAYRNAARTVRDSSREITAMIRAGEPLEDLPGVGKDLAAKIEDLATTGTTAVLEAYRRRLPASLTALLTIPGLGPKRVRALHQALGVHTLEELCRAAREQRIRLIPGFGATTERHILEALEARAGVSRRFKLATAKQYADALVTYLQQAPGVTRITVAGSYRRAMETIGHLDILVTATAESPIMERFVAYEEVAEVLAKGGTRGTVRLTCGLQVDLRVVPSESYGAALQYFTGGKAHNIALRHLAQQRGLKLNEYGVFRDDDRIAGDTEESVYAAVGLPVIPAELRENRGEIEAARHGRLPVLIEADDLRGDLHSHTRASDGRNTLKDMALAAGARGYDYLAVTDHSKRLAMAQGLDVDRLLAQVDEIDRLNASLAGIRLLKGIEVDILEDGSLDLPDEVLGRLDLVIGAVHTHFELPRDRQTERILRAMDHAHFTILAHPSGRLIQERAPYEVDMTRIIRHARQRRCFLEVNAHPERLDLIDVHSQMAKDEGVLLSINSDAHSTVDLDNLRFGVGQARRGWLEAQDVVNSRPLRELRPLLAATM